MTDTRTIEERLAAYGLGHRASKFPHELSQTGTRTVFDMATGEVLGDMRWDEAVMLLNSYDR